MESKNTAKAIGISLPISTKQAVEICNLLRGKSTDNAKSILDKVIEKKTAVPFKRYKHNVGHRKGRIAAGRYPKNASMHILKLIKMAEANAQNIGLASSLIIKKISANKGPKQWHYGRHTRTKMKKTHVNLIVAESELPRKEKNLKTKPKTIGSIQVKK